MPGVLNMALGAAFRTLWVVIGAPICSVDRVQHPLGGEWRARAQLRASLKSGGR